MAQAISKASLQSALLKNNAKLKSYIKDITEGITQFNIIVLEEETLPTENIQTNTIYLLKDKTSTVEDNIYLEYLYINNKWECLGKANNMKMEDYYTKDEVNEKIENITCKDMTDDEVNLLINNIWNN